MYARRNNGIGVVARMVVLVSMVGAGHVFADLPSWETIDFDQNGVIDIEDLNQLLSLGPLMTGYLVEPGLPDPYDLNSDAYVNAEDVGVWLAAAAQFHGMHQPYATGDANLDGSVDAIDLDLWIPHLFSHSLAWDQGDFNCDGVVDGADFGIWNANKSVVPEPVGWLGWLVGLLVLRGGSRACRSAG